jgi:Flp pilus assembly pilin Flp
MPATRAADRNTPLSTTRRVLCDERGALTVEYLVLIACIGLGGIAAMKALSKAMRDASETEANFLASALSGSASPEFAGPTWPDPPSAREREGAPIQRTGGGVINPGNIDPQHPPDDFNGTIPLPNGMSYAAKVRSSKSTALGPNGQSMVTLTVSRSKQIGVSENVSSGEASGKVGLFAGEDVNYRVTIPEADYKRMLAGEIPFADPGDLATLPDGSSVVLRSEDFAGSSWSAGYQLLTAGSSDIDSKGRAVGLEVHGNDVRVLAGPTEAVTQLTSLGLSATLGADTGVNVELNMNGSKSLRYSDLTYADISKSSGQAAFEAFMRSGQVPDRGQVGVGDAGSVRKLDYDESANVSASLSVKGFKLTQTLIERSASARNTDVAHNDGSHDITWIASEHGVSVFESKTLSAAGQQTRSQTGLLLDAADASYAEPLGQAYGAKTENKSYDIQLEMSQAEYDAFRARAIESADRNSPFTDGQIADFKQGKQADPYKTPHTTSTVADVALSHTKVDDFLVDIRLRGDGSNTVTEGLVQIYAETQDLGQLPGRVRFDDNNR